MKKYMILAVAVGMVAGGCESGATIEAESELASLRQAANTYHQAASAKDARAVVALSMTMTRSWFRRTPI